MYSSKLFNVFGIFRRKSIIKLVSIQLRPPLCSYNLVSNWCLPSSSFMGVQVCNRSYCWRSPTSRAEDALKMKDSIQKEYELIYRAPLFYYIKFSYSLAFASLIGFPAIFFTTSLKEEQFPILVSGVPTFQNQLELTVFLALFFIISFQVVYTVLRYPIRIYNNPRSGHYILIYQHILPWKYSQKDFVAGEIAIHSNSIIPWKMCLYKFKNKYAILMEDYFRTPYDFSAMFQAVKKDKE